MKNRWVALSSSVLVFVNTMFLTRQNAQVMPGFERDRGCDISSPARSGKSWFPVSSVVGTFSFSCGFLPTVCFLFFFPWQLFFYFIRSYCSHLQINYKSLFLHGPRALWAQHLQLNTVANLVIFDKCLCALAYAFMIKLCDKVRLPAFNVEIWTMHVAALQNADKMQNLQCFPIAGFLAV